MKKHRNQKSENGNSILSKIKIGGRWSMVDDLQASGGQRSDLIFRGRARK